MAWDFAPTWYSGWMLLASVWHNGLTNREYYRTPWKHAAFMMAGYYAGVWLEKKNDVLLQMIEEKYIKRGVLPEERRGLLTGKKPESE